MVKTQACAQRRNFTQGFTHTGVESFGSTVNCGRPPQRGLQAFQWCWCGSCLSISPWAVLLALNPQRSKRCLLWEESARNHWDDVSTRFGGPLEPGLCPLSLCNISLSSPCGTVLSRMGPHQQTVDYILMQAFITFS